MDVRASTALSSVLRETQASLRAKTGLQIHSRLIATSEIGEFASSDSGATQGPSVDLSGRGIEELATATGTPLDSFRQYPRVDVSGSAGLVAPVSRARPLVGLPGVVALDELTSAASRVGEHELLAKWVTAGYVQLAVLPRLPIMRGSVLVLSVAENELVNRVRTIQVFAALSIATVIISVFMLLILLAMATWRLSRLMTSTVLGNVFGED